MREFWILTKLQLSSLFGINQILHMTNAEEKKRGKRALGTLVAMVFALGYLSIFYSVMLANAFSLINMLPTLLGLMALATSLLILVFSIFETKGVLFGFGDYDIVMSWPVSIRAVATSRVFSMYVNNAVYALLLLLPAGVIYAIKASPAGWYYPLFFVLMLLIPALPTIIGALLGTLLTVATARMKKSNLMGILAQLALVLGIMVFSMRTNLSIADPSKIAGSADFMAAMIKSTYPPALWFQDALTTGSPLSILWLALLSVVSIGTLLLWLGGNFIAINSRIKSKPAGETFVMRRQVRSNRLPALYKRELGRYFSSSLYVVNTAFSYVMLFAAGVALLLKADEVLKYLEMPELPSLQLFIPFFLGWIVSMGTTTASSISMEGKSLWIIKSLPVSAREWFTSKLMVTLVMAIPSILVSSTLIVIGLKPGLMNAIWMYIIPLVYAFAFGVFGLWLNIRMPRLDWKTEAEVVKQGASTMVCVFTGMGVGFAPAIVAGLTGSALVAPITVLVLVTLTLWMWRSLLSSGERRMLQLH